MASPSEVENDQIQEIEDSGKGELFKLDNNQSETYYLASDTKDWIKLVRHRVGQRLLECPGQEQCELCKVGDKPETSWVVTLFHSKRGRTMAIWRYSTESVLKKIVLRKKRLKDAGEAAALRGEKFTVTRANDGFSYEMEWYGNDPTKIEGVEPYTLEEARQKLAPRKRD